MRNLDLGAVARAAERSPGVAHLGRTVSTYAPGRRIDGVRARDDVVEVHVVARWGTPFPEVGRNVYTEVAPIVRGPVEVVIDDVEVGT